MTFTTTTTPELRLKHFASMATSLAHRLETARARNDEHLTQLLEREYAQLMRDNDPLLLDSSNPAQTQPTQNWFQRQWQNLADTIPNLYQLQIQQTVAEDGRQRWLVYYPKTGQTLCTDSETEMQAWVHQNYWNA
ncbi:MAG: hypothetical protein NW220_22430 [Leptolyngbyaceae cyanobacterium bins.349]|nr:hypothetical protein [Leptolyngbyaceae cyanobacterium bins.349]